MAYGIKDLCKIEGFKDPLDMVENFMSASGCPGICTSCGAYYWVEHDCEYGHCGHCNQNTIESTMILMGII